MFGISAYAQSPYAALGENVVVVALTGVAATGNVGTVVAGKEFALTGVQATGSVGTVAVSSSVAVTGVEHRAVLGRLYRASLLL
jgi:hypothetical protein